MAVRLYNEYIKVDPNFIPVFSRNSDRTYPDKWQSFYPHSSFKNILKDIVETLEKSNETEDRSVWMSGASHVIRAINVPDSYAKGTIRISLGKDNTIEEARIIGETLVSILMEQV